MVAQIAMCEGTPFTEALKSSKWMSIQWARLLIPLREPTWCSAWGFLEAVELPSNQRNLVTAMNYEKAKPKTEAENWKRNPRTMHLSIETETRKRNPRTMH